MRLSGRIRLSRTSNGKNRTVSSIRFFLENEIYYRKMLHSNVRNCANVCIDSRKKIDFLVRRLFLESQITLIVTLLWLRNCFVWEISFVCYFDWRRRSWVFVNVCRDIWKFINKIFGRRLTCKISETWGVI